jgi:hypothetical protein
MSFAEIATSFGPSRTGTVSRLRMTAAMAFFVIPS